MGYKRRGEPTCFTLIIDGQPVRVRGDRQPTEADINAIRDVRDAMLREARRASTNHWPWDANGSEVEG